MLRKEAKEYAVNAAIEYLKKSACCVVERHPTRLIDLAVFEMTTDTMVFIVVKHHRKIKLSNYTYCPKSVRLSILRQIAKWRKENKWFGKWRRDNIDVYGDGDYPIVDRIVCVG